MLFLFLSLLSLASADYHIDDTNTTLTYSSGPKAAWAPYAVGGETLELLLPNGTYQVIDAFVCWNHTYRYAACFDTDSCLLTVPFTGSGITVFVYQAGPVGINASISIDGAHAQTNVLSAPPGPAYQIANVSMFDVQQLLSGPHTLSLLINDLEGSYSGMMFDYAYVNESLVDSVTSTSSATPTTSAATTATTTSSASTSSPPTHSSDSHVGPIVGGVVAAVALIVIAVLAFLWLRRRRAHTPDMVDLHSGDRPAPFNPHALYDPPLANSAVSYSTTNSPPGHVPTQSRNADVIPLVPNRLEPQRSAASPSGSQDVSIPIASAPSTSNTSSTNSKTRLVLSNESAVVSSSQSQTGLSLSDQRQSTSPLLTDEQADFINSLHQNNVPAAAIARVVQRMLADQHAGIREWERETRLARTNTMTTAPPSYDLATEMEQVT